jgi:hypothetical protein
MQTEMSNATTNDSVSALRSVNAGGDKLTNVGYPVTAKDVETKNYVDSSSAANRLSDLSSAADRVTDPTNHKDLATKLYVDSKVASVANIFTSHDAP